MSWVKKRTQTTAPPPVQMYNPNQHSNQENQWHQQSHDNWYSQQQPPPKQETKPQQNYWQQPQQYQQQPYNNQQYAQYQEPTNYYQSNTPSYQQQPYGNLQYSQQYNQNNVYGAPPQQEGDGWGSSWGWGDEDNSNIQNPTQAQEQNNVAESFSNDEAWNWSLDEAPKSGEPGAKSIPTIDRLTGKKNKLETPQWSVESQMSQESSDDILQTSESDKSRMLSRSSTISHSPISTQDLPPVETKEDAENKEILSHVKGEVLQESNSTPPPPPQANVTDDPKNNPFKRNTGLSHKAANKFRNNGATPPLSLFQPFHAAQSVNLETLPDNSEQPDPIPTTQPSRKISPAKPQTWAENNEAPINDRNQYLETAQLSDVDLNNFNQASEGAGPDNDALPPPGLRRMVPGRTEHSDNPPMGGEDPPPNFSRMVPGQLETASGGVGGEPNEPPEGLHRMIPGESSSPETSLRQQYQIPPSNDSEPEFNELISLPTPARSATIGADTPPVAPPTTSNRSETIGADTSPDPAKPSHKSKSLKNRRESIEGQNQDGDVGSLVNSVRNLTVGEQQIDDDNIETNARRHSRQESSDSEHEARPKSPMDRRRYKDEPRDRDRDRNKSRYSPEDYRDKKYDRRRYKERRYEEDTDYYSDKERERRHRDDREYDRKYNSLRKDKDKDRRRRDYGRDTRKNDYYYGRYEEDYENESRSRASSRSDSMHESYRDRDRGHERERRDRRHRDKDRHRRHRDPFNPYTQGFGYDVYSQYYQQYQYYENLRKTNPQAYAQLYRKYYQEASGDPPYHGEDRASVHSGRSSANDELAKDRYTRQSYYSQTSLPHLGGYYRGSQTHSISGQYGLDDSSFVRTLDQTDNSLNYEDPQLTAQRLTPAKFATAHIKACISSGKLVKILPNYPLDGQAATVELANFDSYLCSDEDYQELKRFPGPLVKGTTHKKTIIEYCENKIKDATYNQDISDRESYVLMWELLILLIRQNGMVVGADIAELLLKNRPREVPPRPSSTVSSVGSNVEPEISQSAGEVASATNLKEEEITNKFREYLLYGSGKEALEWAMKHGLWGHALFLASKLDKRTYANVLMRFANGLTMNDPLQTLYQLLSGRTPAAVTCVADEKWGDWRPHLAMILSNSTQRPELNCKAITILGDTLMGRGSLFAAQFCYLMAEVGFGQYGSAEAKLVLLGSNHNSSFAHFATNEAIHMTEIYEYARSLNDDEFALANFQRYKYLLSTRLADMGLLEKALSYLEKIANFIVKNPSAVDSALVNDVYLLADRLKYYDPVGDGEDDADFDSSRLDNAWLKDLRRIQNDYNMGLITQNTAGGFTNSARVQEEQAYAQNQDVWQQQQQQQYEQYQQQQQWNEQPAEPAQIEYQKTAEHQQPESYSNQYQEQQQYWPGQQQWGAEQPNSYQEPVEQQQQQNYYGSLAQSEPDEVEKKPPEVSTCNANASASKSTTTTTLRKRLTSHSLAPKCQQQLKSLDSVKSGGGFGKKTKIYPFKNRSAEDFIATRDTFDKRNSSRDSSDVEYDANLSKKKNVFYKNEEKSQLICYKDNTKIIAIKNDSKLTKYNTFDMKFNDKKGKIVKYKSLDVPETNTVVKYYDSQSNVAISAQDFNSDFKLTKFDRKKHKHDIITDTVDAWAKKSSSNVFSNIKNSIFKSNKQTKEVIYKPLVFGGTFPIDVPLQKIEKPEATAHKVKKLQKTPSLDHSIKFREYGPPKTFDIDRPI